MSSILKLFKPSPSDDKRLDAIAARTEAQRSVTAAGETLERLQAVVRVSDDAAHAASAAARAANEARTRWVQNGCPYSGARELQGLDDIAAESARAAERAGRDAAAVSKELARAEEAIRSAESELRDCERRVRRIIALEFVEELAPTLDRRARLLSEVHAADIEIHGLMEYLDEVSNEAAQRLEAAVSRVRIESIPTYSVTSTGTVVSRPPDEVLALTRVWRERAAQLRADPDSEIC
jgi:hypothetical protein